jgi:8-oxo-dGTP diphosphatase
MKTERQISSGGVIFRKRKALIEVALISVKGGKVWGLPKGTAEKGENLARTAHREVKEETGLDGSILENLGHIEYFYTFKEGEELKRYFKIVYFFLMEYTGGDVKDHDHEVDECRWFPIDEAIEALKYKDEKEIVKKAKAIIEGKK